jgi:hypothetical protein
MEVSVATATPVTLFTLPSVNFATYILSVGLNSGDTANYHDVAIICTQGSSVSITTLVNSNLVSITNTGLAIKGTQSSGITSTIQARLACLNRE